MTTWLRNVRPYGGPAEDIAMTDGRIAARRSATADPIGPGDIDGAGRVLTPPLVEAHTHLDKTLWGQPWLSRPGSASLRELIDNERAILRTQQSSIAERSGGLVEHLITLGTQHVRSHVDADPALGWSHMEAMFELRERYRDLIDIEFVAFPQGGLLINPGALELMHRAAAAGMEVVGGLDPCGIDLDPTGHLTAVFELAAEFDRGVDIHLHDDGSLGLWQVERICDFTERYGRQARVMLSHAFCLGTQPWSEVAPVADRMAALGVHVDTTAPADVAVPPFHALTAAGVTVCLGSDGIRDAWSPLGDGDLLDRIWLQAYRFYERTDEGLRAAFDAGTTHGARALGRSDYGLDVGHPATFVLLEGETLGDAIVTRSRRRTVIRHGRVIVAAGELVARPA